MSSKGIAILGSTGSIGVNTLDVCAQHPDRYRVVALSAGQNSARMIAQAKHFRPEVVAMADTKAAAEVTEALAGENIRVLAGEEGVIEVASWASAQMTVSAIVGGAGLRPTLAAIRARKDIALANKECLVMAGSLFMAEIGRYQVRLIPVDSEHSAIFQVFQNSNWMRRLVLTASGGPFRGWRRQQLHGVTPAQAVAHPNWSMGRKISVDSSTMMNKGLEVIEAHWLFGLPAEQIDVVVHPQSIVHSMVEYQDGSVLAQMGVPDMRTPIAVALAWPERIPTTVKSLDLPKLGQLDFYDKPDKRDFPCLELAYEALRRGGIAPVVLNAANEIAVAAFLEGAIGYLEIADLIVKTMDYLGHAPIESIDHLFAVDLQARMTAQQLGRLAH
ncbi:1-deoxy-D-xylulose 5-phosphate reductoisomerase [Magnetococcus marinus MC-1]|uniref:1-deoxy-D-xylulose 5-phosphate reductoisomerase n=1 Tax=Magnetococcus marinus (strain ATCC BAA-1437 / JCM 17883 / MC-1) TaxID=156889 RepID=A0L8R1_MAGMM|nr:1-deoxy-D-xylulose-5-phosphate reductoisomerase [Magnetococcus marinus]ABK44354.1 1-deoxy-D-xylulose 5-phosphate reductoisomerase [Magnetococcus marinus MC-1]